MFADVEETCERKACELCCPDLCIKSKHLCMCVFTHLYIISSASALCKCRLCVFAFCTVLCALTGRSAMYYFQFILFRISKDLVSSLQALLAINPTLAGLVSYVKKMS